MRLSAEDYMRTMEHLYNASKEERLGLIPLLTSMEIEQLQQLFHPTWDGNIISKSTRDSLWEKNLVDRWEGWNFVSRFGMCVLDTLCMLDEDWRQRFPKRKPGKA